MSQPTVVDILQRLIRFDTTNPPGNERACIEYLDGLFQNAGIETSIVAKDPARPNLIARVAGSGMAGHRLKKKSVRGSEFALHGYNISACTVSWLGITSDPTIINPNVVV